MINYDNDDDETRDAKATEVEELCKDVVQRRDALAHFMEHLLNNSLTPRKLQEAVLATCMDIRVLCSRRLAGTILHSIAWRPSKALVTATDSATKLLLERTIDGPGRHVTRHMQRLVLGPAVRSALYSGSALSGYLVAQAGKGKQEVDDAANFLQDTARKSDLESLVALQHEALRIKFLTLLKAKTEGDDEEELGVMHKDLLTYATTMAKEISARPRNCPERFAAPLLTALEEDFYFALGKEDNESLYRTGFLEFVEPFVRLFKPQHQINDARKLWTEQVELATKESTTMPIILTDEDFESLDMSFVELGREAFHKLEKALGVATHTKKKQQANNDSDDEESEEDQDEDDEGDEEEESAEKPRHSTSSKRSRSKSHDGNSSASSKRRKQASEDEDDGDDDDDDSSAKEINKNLFATSESDAGQTAAGDELFEEGEQGSDGEEATGSAHVQGVRPRRRGGRVTE
mmetsp:Transcript_3256/g.5569  ORF Transcript_3256/g.5569 Transcript_3256/m.5569 type:complete len:463 (+) Transcript_3256:3-1391(+)